MQEKRFLYITFVLFFVCFNCKAYYEKVCTLQSKNGNGKVLYLKWHPNPDKYTLLSLHLKRDFFYMKGDFVVWDNDVSEYVFKERYSETGCDRRIENYVWYGNFLYVFSDSKSARPNCDTPNSEFSYYSYARYKIDKLSPVKQKDYHFKSKRGFVSCVLFDSKNNMYFISYCRSQMKFYDADGTYVKDCISDKNGTKVYVEKAFVNPQRNSALLLCDRNSIWRADVGFKDINFFQLTDENTNMLFDNNFEIDATSWSLNGRFAVVFEKRDRYYGRLFDFKKNKFKKFEFPKGEIIQSQITNGGRFLFLLIKNEKSPGTNKLVTLDLQKEHSLSVLPPEDSKNISSFALGPQNELAVGRDKTIEIWKNLGQRAEEQIGDIEYDSVSLNISTFPINLCGYAESAEHNANSHDY
jgi:hypothetical protein